MGAGASADVRLEASELHFLQQMQRLLWFWSPSHALTAAL